MTKFFRVIVEAVSVFALVSVMVPTEGLADKEDKSVKQSTKEISRDVKQTGREISDEVCETVNGKLECLNQKVKHKIQNTAEDTKTKTGN